MKKLIIVAVITLFTSTISATEQPVKPNEYLRTEIVNLIGNNPSFTFEANELTIDVIFTINNQSEIIIISTSSPSKTIEKQIKRKLNYKKIDFKITKPGEMFLLPLKIKKS